MDICSVVTPTEKLFAFLSVTWGMVSDVDIESEKYRYLGETRFLVGAIIKILGLRTYRGRLSYLPANHTGEGEKNLAYDSSPAEVRQITVTENHVTRSVSSEHNFRSEELDGIYSDGITASPSHNVGPRDNLLPPLGSQVPSNWVVEDGEFILGGPMFLSHLGTDIMANPDGKFGDGVMGMFYVKSGVGRMTLMDLFGKMKDGSHVLSRHVEYAKALAFRLEPDTSQSGIIAVDGERIDYVPIQGQIHRSLAKLMCIATPEY